MPDSSAVARSSPARARASIRSPIAHAVVALACVTSGACQSVSRQPWIAARLDEVDGARLRGHVEALSAIGPRPCSDAAASRAALDYIEAQLRGMGFEVREESFQATLPESFFAVVRRADDPDATPQEIELPIDVVFGGAACIQAAGEALKAEGWAIDGYRQAHHEPGHVREGVNLLATHPGASLAGEVIEVGAHYDTVPRSPGANDDASGVAALLEVARAVAGIPTRRTVRLCFFGAEELALTGSKAHVANLRRDSGERVIGLIALDPVGATAHGPGSQRRPEELPWFFSFPDEGDFILVFGKNSSGWLGNLIEGALEAYVPELPYWSANRIGGYSENAGRGDHASYWAAGFPAAALHDTSELRTDTYHRPSDLADTLDYSFLERVSRATAAAVLHWAELEPMPETSPAVERPRS